MTCRICRAPTDDLEYEFYVGFGRLCPECDDRANVVTNAQGEVINVIDTPEAGEE